MNLLQRQPLLKWFRGDERCILYDILQLVSNHKRLFSKGYWSYAIQKISPSLIFGQRYYTNNHSSIHFAKGTCRQDAFVRRQKPCILKLKKRGLFVINSIVYGRETKRYFLSQSKVSLVNTLSQSLWRIMMNLPLSNILTLVFKGECT